MYRTRKQKKSRVRTLAKTFVVLALLFSFFGGFVYSAPQAYALLPGGGSPPPPPPPPASGDKINNSEFQTGGIHKTKYQCGSGDNAVFTSIDIGCKGDNCKGTTSNGCSALTDMVFAIIRALSVGVGLVIVASTIFAGIQYTTSRDDPSAVGKAKERILNNVIALLVYIFSFAILNYIIPNGFFQ